MTTFDVTISGSERAMKALRGALLDDRTFQSVAPKVFQLLREWQREVFRTQGRAATGARWPGYSGAELQYLKNKQNILGDSMVQPPLLRWARDKERLQPSLTKAGHKDQIAHVLSDGWEFGTKVPYAYKHQRGVGRSPFGGGYTIPQRKMLHSDPDVPGINSMLQKITRELRREMGL